MVNNRIMDEVKFIKGNGIFFREPRNSDLDLNWYKWLNDQEVTKFQNKGIFPNTYDKQLAYLNHIQSSSNDVLFSIVEDKSNEHIGCVGLHKIDWVSRSAELGIMIGEKKFWGKKFGKESWNLITEYGFNTLNLHRIFAIVIEDNLSSKKCAINSGYNQEGVMKDYLFKNGNYLNALLYSKINHNG